MPESIDEQDPRKADFDVIIVGAGFAGIQILHSLLPAYSVKVFEAGDGVGGTWYWNRYPGARCDVDSLDYNYTFDPDMFAEWTWSQRYAEQPEIEAYANWVVDRFDLRQHMQLSTRVTSARFEEELGRWTVETDRGDRVSSTWIVFATGYLSAPAELRIPNAERFTGDLHLTSQWPRNKDGAQLAGKRVGVLGTGSSGVQAVYTVAPIVSELVVFQRTPNYVVEAGQRPVAEETIRARKDRQGLSEYRRRIRETAGGYLGETSPRPSGMSPTQARAELDRRWEAGGISGFVVPFADHVANPEDNAVLAEYIKAKIREVVRDPETAEKLIPDHPFFAKRPVMGSGYYEVFNQDNVRLIDVRADPIVSFSERGLVLASGEEIELDVIIAAVGFENLGALKRIDIRGKGRRSLAEVWDEGGPSSYLGLQVAGFPNMFTIFGPGGTGGLNVFAGMELNGRLIRDCLDHMRSAGLATVEPSREAQDWWAARVREEAEAIPLITDSAPSWQRFGGGATGKPLHLIYWGTWSSYADACEAAMARGYPEFVFTPAHLPIAP